MPEGRCYSSSDFEFMEELEAEEAQRQAAVVENARRTALAFPPEGEPEAPSRPSLAQRLSVPRRCAYCGGELSGGKRKDSSYCDVKCRVRAYRARRRGSVSRFQAKETTLLVEANKETLAEPATEA